MYTMVIEACLVQGDLDIGLQLCESAFCRQPPEEPGPISQRPPPLPVDLLRRVFEAAGARGPEPEARMVLGAVSGRLSASCRASCEEALSRGSRRRSGRPSRGDRDSGRPATMAPSLHGPGGGQPRWPGDLASPTAWPSHLCPVPELMPEAGLEMRSTSSWDGSAWCWPQAPMAWDANSYAAGYGGVPWQGWSPEWTQSPLPAEPETPPGFGPEEDDDTPRTRRLLTTPEPSTPVRSKEAWDATPATGTTAGLATAGRGSYTDSSSVSWSSGGRRDERGSPASPVRLFNGGEWSAGPSPDGGLLTKSSDEELSSTPPGL